MGLKPVVIDIYQGNVINDWNLVKDAGIQGVIHKASEGGGWKDGYYGLRRDIDKMGFLYGAYHFANPTPVREQVANFVGQVRRYRYNDEVLLALDWEDAPRYGRMTSSQAVEWLSRICDEFKRDPSGVWIYTGHVGKEEINTAAEIEFFSKFQLWVAQYGVSRPSLPRGWSGYGLWQYSDQFQLRGTGTKIDFNVCGVDDVRKIWAPGTSKSHAAQTVKEKAFNEPLSPEDAKKLEKPWVVDVPKKMPDACPKAGCPTVDTKNGDTDWEAFKKWFWSH